MPAGINVNPALELKQFLLHRTRNSQLTEDSKGMT
jgi:hypothetical protein